MRARSALALALGVCSLLATDHPRAEVAYLPCAARLQSADPTWSSIASRMCTSLSEAARLSRLRDTPEGKAGIHQLYLDTFNVAALVKHVAPHCIRRWGFSQEEIERIVETEVYGRVAAFVLERPDEFNYKQATGLRIGPLGRKSGQLLTRIVASGRDDIDVTWDFICVDGECKAIDITVFGATLSDQVRASLQSRCHP